MRTTKPTSKNKPPRYPSLSFRVSKEEKRKALAFAERIKQINPFMTTSDVFRELMSLSDNGVITPQMRAELSGKSFSTASESGDAWTIEGVQRIETAQNEEKKQA